MSRVLLLTVGTSLFHSATWDATGPLEPIRGYQSWLEGEKLRVPKAREGDLRIQRGLEAELLESETVPGQLAAGWVEALPAVLTAGDPAASEAMRYSAELATLIKMADAAQRPLRNHLASYEKVVVAVDEVHRPVEPKEGDMLVKQRYSRALERYKGWVSALHLLAYVGAVLGEPRRIERLDVPGLTSTTAEELLQAVVRLGEEAGEIHGRHEAVDFVVTGGFKLYGYVLAGVVRAFESDDTGLHYIHEGGDNLVTLKRRELVIGNRTAAITYGLP